VEYPYCYQGRKLVISRRPPLWSHAAAAGKIITWRPGVWVGGHCGSAPMTVSLSSRSPKPLSASEECTLEPKDVFKECDECLEMIVVPSGSFTMGSPSSLPSSEPGEAQVRVTIAKPSAVGQFAVTFDGVGRLRS
jgi:formylglycine-generating enzyme required for sulfatase activity